MKLLTKLLTTNYKLLTVVLVVLLTTHYSLLTAHAFIGPNTSAGSGGGFFKVDANYNIGFGTADPTPVSTFNTSSTEGGFSGNFGYVFTIASTSNPGISIKNLAASTGNTWIWSSRNFGNLQLYRESGTLPGYVVMDINPYGDVAIGQKATSTGAVAKLFVGGNVQTSGSFIGAFSGNLSAANVTGPSAFGSSYGTYSYAFPGALAVGTSTTVGLPAGGLVLTNAANANNRHLVFSGYAGNTWDFYGGHGGGGYFGIAENQGTPFFTVLGTSGNVGIGTTSPGDKLSVAGNIGAGGSTFASPGGTSGQGIALPSTANDVIRIFGEHNGGDTSNGIFYTADNTNDGWYFRQADCCGAGTLDYMRIARDGVYYAGEGNFGIGTTGPGEKLDVRGNILSKAAANGNTWGMYLRSDANTLVGKFEIGGSETNHNGTIGILTNNSLDIITGNTSRIHINDSTGSGNVGIATTTPAYPLTVAGTIYSSTGGFRFPDGTIQTTAAASSFTNLTVSGTSTFNGNIAFGGQAVTNLDMNGFNITGVNKLSVTTIDPLYRIGGVNYSTYAPSIAGGVKEEFIGRGQLTTDNKQLITNNYEYAIDFSKLKEGSDLWVWYKAVDFSKDNVEVLVTPIGTPVPIAYEIDGNRIIFTASAPLPTTHYLLPTNISFSYRLVGKRFDWKEWPTRAKDQSETPGLIIKE